MKLYIPTIGERFTLIEPWTFEVFAERRNIKLFEYLKLMVPYESTYGNGYRMPQNPNPPDRSEGHEAWNRWNNMPFTLHTFPVGTPIKVARIYIRAGVSDYDSLTLSIVKNSIPGVKKHIGMRFWAKLADVNKMVVELD